MTRIGKYTCNAYGCKIGLTVDMYRHAGFYWYEWHGRFVRVTDAELNDGWYREFCGDDIFQMEIF